MSLCPLCWSVLTVLFHLYGFIFMNAAVAFCLCHFKTVPLSIINNSIMQLRAFSLFCFLGERFDTSTYWLQTLFTHSPAIVLATHVQLLINAKKCHQQQFSAFRHRNGQDDQSEWGTTTVWLLVPDGLLWVVQMLPIYWDFLDNHV